MSTYATLDNFKARLGSATSPVGLYQQLTDRTGGTTASDTVGQEIVDQAEGEANGYLARRYAVPVVVASDATLAAALRTVTLDVAEHGAWVSHPFRRTVPERVRQLYEAALKWLQAIAEGELNLPSVDPVASATAAGTTGEAGGHDRIFTEDAWEGL